MYFYRVKLECRDILGSGLDESKKGFWLCIKGMGRFLCREEEWGRSRSIELIFSICILFLVSKYVFLRWIVGGLMIKLSTWSDVLFGEGLFCFLGRMLEY